MSFGAQIDHGADGRDVPSNVFNGKIDAPKLYRTASAAMEGGNVEDLIAAWDFSQGIDSWDISDVSGNGHHGKAINQPMRGATGHNWRSDEHTSEHQSHM